MGPDLGLSASTHRFIYLYPGLVGLSLKAQYRISHTGDSGETCPHRLRPAAARLRVGPARRDSRPGARATGTEVTNLNDRRTVRRSFIGKFGISHQCTPVAETLWAQNRMQMQGVL